MAIDLSAKSIASAKARCPGAEFHCQDIRAPFPVTNAGVIVASLSMHYFASDATVALAARIRDTLRPAGILLCRLNSTNDHHYGASGHAEVEPRFYLVDDEPKRFFDRDAVTDLFAKGWIMLSIGELVIDRYDHLKTAWEVILEKAA